MKLTIGKRLKQLRKQKGLSQEDLADMINFSRSTISKWESDLSLPDLEVLIELTELYQVSIASMIGIEEENKSISEIYDLIQSVFKNIQKNNHIRNIIQILTIALCMISLLVSVSLNHKINTLQPPTKATESSDRYTTMDFIEEQIQGFNQLNVDSSILSDRSLMDVNVYDLEAMTVSVIYEFYLTHYQENTEVMVEFKDGNDHVMTYPCQKVDDNIFVLKQEIPLKDYYRVSLIIRNGQEITQLDISKDRQCHYLSHAICCQLDLAIGRDVFNRLQLDTITFTPEFTDEFYQFYFKNLLKGTMQLRVYEESSRNIVVDTTVPFDQSSSIPILKPLSPNMTYAIDVKINLENGECFFTGYHQNLGPTFTIPASIEQNEDFQIFKVDYFTSNPLGRYD